MSRVTSVSRVRSGKTGKLNTVIDIVTPGPPHLDDIILGSASKKKRKIKPITLVSIIFAIIIVILVLAIVSYYVLSKTLLKPK